MSSEWSEVRLEEVTSVLGDGLHGTPNYDENGEYFFINGNNFSNGKIVIDDKTKRASEEEYLKHKKNLNDRTILVSINGTIGNIGLYNGEKVILGKSACYFNVLEDVDKQFIRYIVTSSHFQNYINSLATGSTIKNVSLKLMRNYTFRIPPLEIQQQISKVLEDLDSKIELNRQTNQTLEQIAQAIFKSWFVDFDPVRAKIAAREAFIQQHPEVTAEAISAAAGTEGDTLAHAGAKACELAAICAISGKTEEQLNELDADTLQQLKANAALFPDELVETELDEIPEGWACGTLSDIVSFGDERIDVSNLSLENYISTENMLEGKKGITVASSLPCVKTVPAFNKGQILVSNIRPYFKKIWLAQFEGGRSNDVLGFDADDSESIEFLYNLLFQDAFFNFMMTTSKGAKMPRGDKSAILAWTIPIPDLALRREYSNAVKSYYEYSDSLIKENGLLKNMRDSLLPKLLSGELTIGSATTYKEAVA